MPVSTKQTDDKQVPSIIVTQSPQQREGGFETKTSQFSCNTDDSLLESVDKSELGKEKNNVDNY